MLYNNIIIRSYGTVPDLVFLGYPTPNQYYRYITTYITICIYFPGYPITITNQKTVQTTKGR